MRWLLRYPIYVLAAFALYRLQAARGLLWWALLSSAILMAGTHAAMRSAVSARASADLAAAINPALSVDRSAKESTQVVRTRLRANVILCVITLALSIWALR